MNDINTASGTWFCGDSGRCLSARIKGWPGLGRVLKGENYRYVTAKGNVVLAANRKQLMISTDGGTT